jgi:RNA polymerase sigma factor (sigma-70 family)
MDKFSPKIYNTDDKKEKETMINNIKFDGPGRLGKDQAREIFRNNIKYIKKTIKKKIGIYEPLDFKTAFNEFVLWIQDEEYEVLRKIPAKSAIETYLDDLIRNFLIEKTYFIFLFEDRSLVTQFVIDTCRKYGIPGEFYSDIETFVKNKLENKTRLEKIKESFKEKSKLKTYFYTSVHYAVVDYERKYNVKKAEPGDCNDLDKLESSTPGPHVKSEAKEIKERVQQLDYKEKIAFKMYYYESITNLSAIAGTLRTTRHKAGNILKTALKNVLKGGG